MGAPAPVRNAGGAGQPARTLSGLHAADRRLHRPRAGLSRPARGHRCLPRVWRRRSADMACRRAGPRLPHGRHDWPGAGNCRGHSCL
jgi:hypothetical protein